MAYLDVVKYVSGLNGTDVAPPPQDLWQSPVLIVTGQSSSKTSRMPELQRRFCHSLFGGSQPVPEFAFPWAASFSAERRKEPSLYGAAWRNARQFLAAQFSSRFQSGCTRLFKETISTQKRDLVLITGSCGFQISIAALNRLTLKNRLLLISLGAVGFARNQNPKVKTCVIRGRGDVISRMLSSVAPDHYVDCGHMAYWQDPDVIDLCRRSIDAFFKS